MDVLNEQLGVAPTDKLPSVSMARFMLSYTRETGMPHRSSLYSELRLSNLLTVVLLFVHRPYFAQALIENAADPTRSPYSRSFLATVRAASTILRSIKDQFASYPAMCSRFCSIWTHAYSAAVSFDLFDQEDVSGL